MKRKSICMCITLTILTGCLTIYAYGKSIYKADVTDSAIYYSCEKIFYDMPIVNIDGSTYIPLRETAEKAGCSVELSHGWIFVDSNRNVAYPNDEEKALFKMLFWELPTSAKIVNFNLDYEDEICYAAKVSFDMNDLQYILEHSRSVGIHNMDNGNESEYFQSAADVSEGLKTICDWWDLKITKNTLISTGETNFSPKSNWWMYIDINEHGNYLYVGCQGTVRDH